LKLGRWPVSNINSSLYFDEDEENETQNGKDKTKLETILNKNEAEDLKSIDSITQAVLYVAFRATDL
jgi:hypothetical protein